MRRMRIFISSVQNEFAEERQMLFHYISSDALLGKFFDPFIFENHPATENHTSEVFYKEVENCDLYLGLFGKEYGSEDAEGVSPTEREFDYAGKLHKNRLIFITNHTAKERNPKELKLIKKAEKTVVRKCFSSVLELKTAVYASLIRYLEETEFIRTAPFDATLNQRATLDDIDQEKIEKFVAIAQQKRNFPLHIGTAKEMVLTHLNLLQDNRLTNASILLFGKQPQRFFITSEVKCAHFHGTSISKPIPSYQVYKGDVFQLVDQAVDFVLSRIDLYVGTRDEQVDVPTQYELPKAAVAEAIVNAVVHRDYTSNGSVQVMLFKDRLEIWNPGVLPMGLTVEKLRKPHNSIPANPLLAEPMYLAGYIERMGTGTGDIIRLSEDSGLKDPVFIQDELFKTIIFRKEDTSEQSDMQEIQEVDAGSTPQVTPQATPQATPQVNTSDNQQVNIQATPQATPQVTPQVTPQATEEELNLIQRVTLVVNNETRRAEIQDALGLKDANYFRDNYLNPALKYGYIEMSYPDNPNHPNQTYRLTEKGLELRTRKSVPQVALQATNEELRLIQRVTLVVNNEAQRTEIQDALGLKDVNYFRDNYLNPALKYGYIEMSYPDNPNHPNQSYRLTAKGLELKKKRKKY